MRIKHYVVTYRNPVWIECVRSILRTPTEHERSITVINNHTEFAMPEDLAERVQVLHNTLRPDWSTGHLARNWNQAIIHGFGNLVQPHADIVVTSQNDSTFEPGYLDRLIDAHQRFDIITSGDGDNCVSYTAAGVRRVGLWDERFCSIFHQEGDYFARAAKFLGERASINDHCHGRVRNPIDIGLCTKIGQTELHAAIRNVSNPTVHLTAALFGAKWSGLRDWPWQPQGEGWNTPETATITLPSFILYPYFEGPVETLREQNYIA